MANILDEIVATKWREIAAARERVHIGTLERAAEKMPPARSFAAVWIETARNTPALFQIYMIYFGLGSLGIFVDSFPALLIGIALACAITCSWLSIVVSCAMSESPFRGVAVRPSAAGRTRRRWSDRRIPGRRAGRWPEREA